MATNLTKLPILRTVVTRGYATEAAACKAPTSGFEVETTCMPNKLVVASVDAEVPISRISIVVKAGSRNETPETLGVAHTLRVCTGLSTRNSSQFAITRNIQQAGASLTATANRELISYTLEGTKKAIEDTLPFLTEVATQQIFKPWEVSDTVQRMRLELAQRPPQLRAVDLLHKAAYRRGLGNSLFIPKYRLGAISSETLQHYVASTFTAERSAVIGFGVNHAKLVEYASKLNLPSGAGPNAKAVYKGGEVRSDKAGDYAYIAVGTASAGLCQAKELLPFNILQRALGGSPAIKWSRSDHGLLSKCLGDVEDPFAFAAFNYVYSDTGLFGVLAAVPGKSAGKVLEAAIKALKTTTIDEQAICRAKNQLKVDLLMAGESASSSLEDIASQAALTGSVKNPNQLAEAIDEVNPSAVVATARKIAAAPLSIAAYGNLQSLPFLDEVQC